MLYKLFNITNLPKGLFLGVLDLSFEFLHVLRQVLFVFNQRILHLFDLFFEALPQTLLDTFYFALECLLPNSPFEGFFNLVNLLLG